MATKKDTIAKLLIKEYKEHSADSGFVIVDSNHDISWMFLNELRNHARKYRMKSFHIKDIVPISSDILAPISMGLDIKPYHKGKIFYGDRQGIFRLEFSDGTIMYFAKYFSGQGANAVIEGLFAAEKSTWYNFIRYINRTAKRTSRPKPGFYATYTTHTGQLIYSSIDRPSEVDTIHPVIDSLNEDISFFFNNVNIFTKYKQPGVRKVMLIGPPGTGKTSMCVKLARERSSEIPVIVATELDAAAAHLTKCAKLNISTIVILEDAETTMDTRQGGANSGVLNFLDGVNQPTNNKGAYIIMTTNHPDRIEDRVLKRPGRIDKIFKVDELKDEYALKCAQLYFGKALRYTKKTKEALTEVVTGMTGAQIRELSNSCRAVAAQSDKTLNVELIKEVKNQITADLSDAHKYAEDNSLVSKVATRSLGFLTGYDD